MKIVSKHLFVILLLSAFLPLAAQNNPYEIDDICYESLQRAEQTVDDLNTDEFEQANARLLELAIVRHDEKARTLYYVFALRRLCRKGEVATPEQRKQANDAVDHAFNVLLDVSRETGLTQYYYYSYDLTQNYYFGTGQISTAFTLLNKMLEDSEQENDEYGQYDRALISIAIRMSFEAASGPIICCSSFIAPRLS